MKRILIVPLILILCFSIFVGCNNSASSNNESNSGDTNATTQCEHDDIRQSIPDLNMATLISLVEIYGENVTWDTFAPYYYEEIGSGMYILLYPIVDANYYLLIGGSSPYTSPMYIRLVPTDYPDHSIDIRTESITDFLNIEYSGSEFEPGVILLGLNEAYTGNIRELFPQLEIAEVEDIYLKRYEKIVNQPGMDEQIENIRGKIGTEFIIKLTDTTKKAVGIGIASIEGNPLIAYAMPNYVVEPVE